jgi:hypothetical protein
MASIKAGSSDVKCLLLDRATFQVSCAKNVIVLGADANI